MRWFRSESASVSAEDERILKETIIDDQGRPGPILHDFTVLLDYIESHDLTLTATHQLSLWVLPEINARLTRPIEHGLKRPQPKSYPHIHGLYLLLRASGLTFVEASRGKPRLRLDQAVTPAWQALSPVERYGSLLESWLLRGQPEIIGEAHSWAFGIPDNFQNIAHLFDWLPDSGLPVGDHSDVQEHLRFTPGAHNLGLLDLFGLITIQPDPPIAGQGWQIARIERTPLGRALRSTLYINKGIGGQKQAAKASRSRISRGTKTRSGLVGAV